MTGMIRRGGGCMPGGTLAPPFIPLPIPRKFLNCKSRPYPNFLKHARTSLTSNSTSKLPYPASVKIKSNSDPAGLPRACNLICPFASK